MSRISLKPVEFIRYLDGLGTVDHAPYPNGPGFMGAGGQGGHPGSRKGGPLQEFSSCQILLHGSIRGEQGDEGLYARDEGYDEEYPHPVSQPLDLRAVAIRLAVLMLMLARMVLSDLPLVGPISIFPLVLSIFPFLGNERKNS